MPPRFTRYQVLVSKGRHKHGEKFDESGLAPQMVRWFNNGMLIKVRDADGNQRAGRVTATTVGQRPVFMLTAGASGASTALGLGDVVVACKRSPAGQYRPVQ